MRLEQMVEPNILFFDIETTPIKTWTWRLGETILRHDQLDESYSEWDIICIGYKLNDAPAKILHWGYNSQNSKSMIEEFDRIANSADIIVGKNSDRFDIKYINTLRMRHNLPGNPNWLTNTDDLEKQMRKYFAFPSYALDYVAKNIIKTGGKIKMELQDWIDIVERNRGSKEKYDKMLNYCKKDVEDTALAWNRFKPYFKPKFNMATFRNQGNNPDDYFFCCSSCGSNKIKKNGTRIRGKTVYQMFYCNGHGGYAGQAPLRINRNDEETLGKIGN